MQLNDTGKTFWIFESLIIFILLPCFLLVKDPIIPFE